ncbi:MAG: SDR family oxidoreductase [Alicyclobacillus macrosporangiidus]|uniref:SDR family NAD(P)-dependent oxidoreductase n=1 Tax=Alicyclobacillus macrosporangiidus TaxID=392015 RepID=UPI0026F0EA26|nr:SDR family NAD(P)-dependent oxidoreductase [Alicyclobacillus macrosporangiidus]MCL6597840.1 SDR family oxidoreductase [Alicyclobacillus macrosporangiidus]
MNEGIRQSAEDRPVIAITGGSAGLGRALAEVLLRRGMAVALCARRERRLLEAVESLEALGPVDGVAGDVADPRFRNTWLSHVVRRFGHLDALVLNASTLGDIPMPFLRDTHIVNLRTVFEVNTFAPVLMLQQAMPLLAARPRALCLAVSSDAAVGGYPGWGVYGASKAALDLLTKTFARETSLDHIAVYSVDPGDMHRAAPAGGSRRTRPRAGRPCGGGGGVGLPVRSAAHRRPLPASERGSPRGARHSPPPLRRGVLT